MFHRSRADQTPQGATDDLLRSRPGDDVKGRSRPPVRRVRELPDAIGPGDGIGIRWRRALCPPATDPDGVRGGVRTATAPERGVSPPVTTTQPVQTVACIALQRFTVPTGRRLHPTGVEDPGRKGPATRATSQGNHGTHAGHGPVEDPPTASADPAERRREGPRPRKGEGTSGGERR